MAIDIRGAWKRRQLVKRQRPLSKERKKEEMMRRRLRKPFKGCIIAVGVILACDRSRPFFYAYYGIKMLTGMLCDGSMQCLSLAYVADKVAEGRRAMVFGILTGISAAGFVSGTLTARFLPTSYVFQVSAAVAVLAAVYMKFFLAETDGGASLIDECSQPLCPPPPSDVDSSPPKLSSIKKVPSLRDMFFLLRSSLTLLRAALITFFGSLADSGYQASLLYFLKAKFHFDKDQFADLLLLAGIAGAFSQLFLMPTLAPVLGEEKLLSIGLLASCTHVFLYSISWAPWVPYLASTFVVMSVFVHPCIRSIVSKNVGPYEQVMEIRSSLSNRRSDPTQPNSLHTEVVFSESFSGRPIAHECDRCTQPRLQVTIGRVGI